MYIIFPSYALDSTRSVRFLTVFILPPLLAVMACQGDFNEDYFRCQQPHCGCSPAVSLTGRVLFTLWQPTRMVNSTSFEHRLPPTTRGIHIFIYCMYLKWCICKTYFALRMNSLHHSSTFGKASPEGLGFKGLGFRYLDVVHVGDLKGGLGAHMPLEPLQRREVDTEHRVARVCTIK